MGNREDIKKASLRDKMGALKIFFGSRRKNG